MRASLKCFGSRAGVGAKKVLAFHGVLRNLGLICTAVVRLLRRFLSVVNIMAKFGEGSVLSICN